IISRGANSGIMSTERAWTESERKVIRESMEDVYDMFLDKTLAGRKRAGVTMSKEKLLTLAGGRVWTGRQAKAAGLVDELGTLDDAIAAAKKMAGVEGKEMEILTLPKPRSFFERLAESGGAETKVPLASLIQGFPEIPKHLRHAETLLRMSNDRVWLMTPYAVEIK
ncbi:MAG: S49 family peptidase, partial [Gemmataceae bacterium]|nr:S49 family peptidase [Gemmataceae bacterium]